MSERVAFETIRYVMAERAAKLRSRGRERAAQDVEDSARRIGERAPRERRQAPRTPTPSK